MSRLLGLVGIMVMYLGGTVNVWAQATPLPPATPPKKSAVDEARDLFRAGKLKEASELLDKFVKENPRATPSRITLAGWMIEANRGSDARNLIEQAAAADPRHPEVLLFNGSVAYGEGRLTDALLSCQAALLAADDKRWEPEQRKRYQRDARLGMASVFENRGDYASAREMLLGILNDDPKNGPTRQRLGAVTFLSGKPEEAFAEFKQAVQDDPALEPAELRIALLSSNRGDRTKAEEWLKKAVTAFPQDARTHRAYAVFLLDDNKPDAASLYIDGAKKLAPQVRETLAIRAMYHRHKREYTAAIELFEQLYKDGPSDAFAIGNLAIVLAETNDEKNRKRAIDLAESLVKLNPRSSESYAVLGWCQFKQGKLDDAEKSLTSAAGAGQISFDTAYYIAKVFNERGKFREARDFLAQVVEATGAFVYRPDARVLLAELQKKVPADPPPEKK